MGVAGKTLSRCVAICAIVMGAAALPAVAGGISRRWVPFKSVAGVHFGWSPAQVRRLLGKPANSPNASLQPNTYFYTVDGYRWVLQIIFQPGSPHNGVTSMSVLDANFTTVGGITAGAHGGSSRAAVLKVFRHYPHFVCHGPGYCTTTSGAAHVSDKYGAIEIYLGFRQAKLVYFDMIKNLLK